VKSISLKREYDSEPSTLTRMDDFSYPMLYMSFPDERLDEVPDSGTITLKFKVTSRTENVRDGECSCGLELQVLSITNIKGDEKKTPDAEEALDTLKALLEKSDD
jgi:hypothetical protein